MVVVVYHGVIVQCLASVWVRVVQLHEEDGDAVADACVRDLE